MRQTIMTKYLGPTNFRGSRVKAWCEAGSIIMPWQSDLDVEPNHRLAAETLHKKLGWNEQTKLIGGWSKHEGAFVQVSKNAN